jgi:hypothetical protein
MHEKIEYKILFVATIWWDAPQSNINASEEVLMEISA